MAYKVIYKRWLPYAKMSDHRGFISQRYGNGHTGVDSVGNQYGNPVCAVLTGAGGNQDTDCGAAGSTGENQ